MDSSASVLARESFTHFGARRGSAWTGAPSSADYTAFGNTTRKGFTGHEMLDSVSLVHMNGRVYDPYLGRFLSPDTVIQSLGATQSINPYAYAWNDPLEYTDPSEHSLWGDILGIGLAAVAFFTFQPELIAATGSAFWGSVAAGAVAGFVGGFTGALIATGSLSAALTAGLVTGITAVAFAGVGYYADSPRERSKFPQQLEPRGSNREVRSNRWPDILSDRREFRGRPFYWRCRIFIQRSLSATSSARSRSTR